jgi:hypothetical protein
MPRKPKPRPVTPDQRDAAITSLRAGASTWKAARGAGVSLAVARQIATEIGARSPAGRKPTVARVITLRLTAAESARLTEVAGGYSQVTAWAREALRRAAGVEP